VLYPEPGPDRQNQVRVLDDKVCVPRPENVRPSEKELMAIADEIHPVPCRLKGNTKSIHKPFGEPGGSGKPYTVPEHQEGTGSRPQRIRHPREDIPAIGKGLGDLAFLVAREGIRIDHSGLYVDGNIEPNRTGSPRNRETKSPFDVHSDSFWIVDFRGVFREAPHHVHDLRFLYSALPNVMPLPRIRAGNLSGDNDEWDRFHERACARVYRVEGAWSRGNEDNSGCPADAPIRARSYSSGLLVMRRNHGHIWVSPEALYEVHGHSTGNHKNVADARSPGDRIYDIIRKFYQFHITSFFYI